ncbi:MAG: 2-dehydropantoate 2-reductase [Cytophagales bacterium]|nr:2-dehydropantoate 2-reductase [Cytophagales bacterium]
MKIAVIGVGGVGGYFGGKLAQAGNDVTFVARGTHGMALMENGLEVRSIQGDFKVPSVKVVNQITELSSPDLVILAVKSWQVKEVGDQINEILHQDSMVLPLQNGVLAIEELSVKINKHHLISGLCRIISKVEGPGVISHFGAVPSIVIGEMDHRESYRVQAIQKHFLDAEVDLKVSENIESELWKKFIMICLSGLQAVTRTTLGELRNTPETQAMMQSLLEEVYGLSQKIGIQIHSSYVEKTMTFIGTLPDETTFSLARDIWDNRPSEMEYQNGTVVQLGARYGYDTPINQFIYSCLLPGELKARK